MKFYTLDFDCNAPMTQQVNVPTNTDYKVGIKVKRNGAYQNLKPAEVTLGTLSADEGDVNGYTTFTLSAGDNASYTQATLDIQHAQDATTLVSTYHNTTGAQQTLPAILSAAVDESAVGKSVTPYDILVYAKTNLSAEPTPSEIAAASELLAIATSTYFDMKTIMTCSKGVMWSFTGPTRDQYVQSFINEGLWKAEDGIPFFFAPTGAQNFSPLKEYTFDGSEVFTIGVGAKCKSDKYAAARVNIGFDQPFDAKFKLNTNVFKSQQGDKAESIESASTAKLVGKFADGTDFDYNLVID